MDENKVLNFEIKDGQLHLSVDPNKNGKPVVTLAVDLLEVPAEVIDGIKAAKK